MLAIPFDYDIKEKNPLVEQGLIADVPRITSMLTTQIRENVKRNGGRFIVNRGGVVTQETQTRVLVAGNSAVQWGKEYLETSVDLGKGVYITVDEAYAAYNIWVKEENIKHVQNRTNFSKSVRDFVITPAARDLDSRVRVGREQKRAFIMTRLRKDNV
jgi:hypothetical protein